MKKLILIIAIFALVLSMAGCRQTPGAQMQPPEPGYYVLSSIGNGEDITFLSDMDPANGYVRLESGGTGVMRWEEKEAALTWDHEYIYWNDMTIPCLYMSSHDPELDLETAVLMLVFLDSETTAAFRSAEEN